MIVVLYHGLGQHVEFVAPDALTVYLKVTYCQDSDLNEEWLILTDTVHRVISLYWMYCLHQVIYTRIIL